MRIKKKTILQWALIIIAFFSFRLYQQQDLTAGQVPSFNSKTITNQVMSSSSPDQAVLIHFWATWCSICKLENDNIQALSKNYQVLNIALQSGSDAQIIKYAEQNDMMLANIINDNSGSLAKLMGVKVTPTSFFIDKHGKIKFTEIGYVTELGYKLRLWWANL